MAKPARRRGEQNATEGYWEEEQPPRDFTRAAIQTYPYVFAYWKYKIQPKKILRANSAGGWFIKQSDLQFQFDFECAAGESTVLTSQIL